MVVKIHEAKTNLSQLLAKLENSLEKEILIARGNEIIAKIVLVPKREKLKSLYGKYHNLEIAPDFDHYIPDEFEDYL